MKIVHSGVLFKSEEDIKPNFKEAARLYKEELEKNLNINGIGTNAMGGLKTVSSIFFKNLSLYSMKAVVFQTIAVR